MGKKYLFNAIEGTFDIVAGEDDYLQASKGTDQQFSTNEDVIFDIVDRSAGSSISLNTSTGRFTLAAGKTYRLMAGIRFEHTAPAKIGFAWYNITNSSAISELARLHNMSVSGDYSSLPVAVTIITPSVETEVTFRCTWEGDNAEDVNAGHTWAIIEKISETIYNVPSTGMPIGTILPWHKHFAGTPSLGDAWKECNGQTISDSESPYDGQAVPNLNGQGRFLRGSNTSGVNQAYDIQSHAHQITADLHDSIGVGSMFAANMGISNYQPRNTEWVGGAETRPINMSVVYIIKIK